MLGSLWSRGRRLVLVCVLLAPIVALTAAQIHFGRNAHALVAARAGWRMPWARVMSSLHASDVVALPQARMLFTTAAGLPVHVYAPLTSMATLASVGARRPRSQRRW